MNNIENIELSNEDRVLFINTLNKIIETLKEKNSSKFYICVVLSDVLEIDEEEVTKEFLLFSEIITHNLRNPPDFLSASKFFIPYPNDMKNDNNHSFWKRSEYMYLYNKEEKYSEIYDEKIKFIEYLINLYNHD